MIIGLVGAKNSGKSTIAKYLENNYNFTELTFAEPLKKICHILSGIPMNIIDPQNYDDRISRELITDSVWNMTGREWLQKIGTELFREHFDSDTWIKLLQKKINNNHNNNIIISDCRFENEYKMIKNNGGIILVIDRPNIKNNDLHISEISWKSFIKDDIIIKNNSTLDDLYKKIDNFIKTHN